MRAISAVTVFGVPAGVNPPNPTLYPCFTWLAASAAVIILKLIVMYILFICLLSQNERFAHIGLFHAKLRNYILLCMKFTFFYLIRFSPIYSWAFQNRNTIQYSALE
jgi:hypothetical protein